MRRASEFEGEDRREGLRFSIQRRARYNTQNGRQGVGTSVNISRHGLLSTTQQVLDVGEFVELSSHGPCGTGLGHVHYRHSNHESAPPDPEAVRGDGGQRMGTAGAGRIARGGGKTARSKDGEVSEESLEMRRFRVVHARRRHSWPLPGPLQSLRMERMKWRIHAFGS